MTGTAKVLQFPMAGVARDLDYRKAYIPSEGVAFATPLAKNVLGECAFSERQRGGSRPGLKPFTGSQPSGSADGKWMWANGNTIVWSGTEQVSRMVFAELGQTIVTPDGSILFDPHETFSVSAAKGSVPASCSAMAMYRARLVVAGGTMWYASRQGDVTDFDYGGNGEDVGRAVAGNVALANRTGETVTAVASLEDRMLVVATARQLRVLADEPTTGEWKIASEHTGIVSRDAWCFDSTTFWFLGTNGLYAMTPGENIPKLASSRLPEDFKGFSSAWMLYDPERNGIHIFATRNSTVEAWFYDIGNQAFWPQEYPAAKRPTRGATALINGVNRVIFLCADGVWRYFDDAQTTDDGSAISSRVVIGPLRTSQRDDMDGMLAELNATLAVGSADVVCKVYAARSPEAAVSAALAGGNAPSYTLGSSWNNVVRVRQRGAWVALALSATGKWGYESMTAICKSFGRLR